jgi:hypothetical protein
MAHATVGLRAGWQRLVAAVFAAALALGPVIALAQAGGGGGGGTGSSAPGSPPPGGGGPPPGGGGGGGSGLAWVIVILAIAVAIWLFTRRRGGPAHR